MQSESVTTARVTPETVQTVERLLDDLRHAEPERRQAARDALHALGPDAALAIREMCRPKLRDTLYELWAETDFPHWILVAIFVAMVPPLLHLRVASLVLFLVAAAAVIAVKWRIRKSALREVRARKLQGVLYLLKLSDKRIVPVLLDLQTLVPNLPDDLDIIPALNRLLPTLEEQDARFLSPRHRAQLNRVLSRSGGSSENVDHRIAVLKALLRVGDRSSIPAVKRLAYARTDSHFRETACCCLEQLERRGAAQDQILLRPLSTSKEPENLLRAAGSAQAADPEALLRAANSSQNSTANSPETQRESAYIARGESD